MELICYSRKISKLLKGWLRERFYPSKLYLLSFETKRDLDAKKKKFPGYKKERQNICISSRKVANGLYL